MTHRRNCKKTKIRAPIITSWVQAPHINIIFHSHITSSITFLLKNLSHFQKNAHQKPQITPNSTSLPQFLFFLHNCNKFNCFHRLNKFETRKKNFIYPQYRHQNKSKTGKSLMSVDRGKKNF